MNYYDVLITFVAGKAIVSDHILGVTSAVTMSGSDGKPHTLVVTIPDGSTLRYNLDKILYWQVHAHETKSERAERTGKISFDKDGNIYQTDYSKFIPDENTEEEIHPMTKEEE